MESVMRGLFAITLTAIGAATSLSGATSSKSSRRWTHYGIRPLAMGNAFVAVADDYNAIFYNPAGLARLKFFDGELLNPKVEISQSVDELAKNATKLASGSTTSAVIDLIEKNTGKDQHLSFEMTPHLIFPNFGFGIGASSEASFAWHRSLAIDILAGLDLVLPISFAFNALEDRLSIGASLKGRLRTGVDDRFSMDDFSAFTSSGDENADQPSLDDYVSGGYGIGADVGLLFTPTDVMEPTLGISITDIGDTPFKTPAQLSQYASVPKSIQQSINLGFSLKPVKQGKFQVLTTMDVHSINQESSFGKKLNFGVEASYGSWAKLQTGLHQGYLSAGMLLDIGFFNLSVATYGVELSEYAGYREQRRYTVQFKFLL